MESHFQRNLEILSKRDRSLAERIARCDLTGRFLVLKSRSGLPTLVTDGGNGVPRFLHSPSDPSREAEKLVKGSIFKRENSTVLFGFGLGYLPRRIAEIMEKGHVLHLFELSAEILKLAMTHTDLGGLLSNTDVHIHHQDSRSDRRYLELIQARAILGGIDKLSIPSLRDLHSSEYDEIDRRIERHIRSVLSSYSSFNSTMVQRIDNLFKNMAHIQESVPIDHLQGALKGKPAIVVAAGPSLTGVIPFLKEKTEELFTIAVDTALAPLLKNGITPDLAAACESHPAKIRAITTIEEDSLKSIPLVFTPTAHPEVVRRFQRKIIANIEDSLASWFVNIDRQVTTFRDLQTVSKLGFLTARLMGADPIILAGLDLSFPLNREHAEGCPVTWTMDFDGGDFLWVPDNQGGKVRTIESFASMIYSFEREIADTRARCINLSKQGAFIQGAEWAPVEKVLKLLNPKSGDQVDLVSGIMHESFQRTDPSKGYSDALCWFLAQAAELMQITTTASTLRSGLPPSGERAQNDLDECFAAAMQHGVFLDILTDYLPGYMASCAGASPEDRRDSKGPALFFQELESLLPLLKSHCSSAIEMFRSP
ncbi:MAG: DUF115 domain-containing protein [Desulfobacteraceae bacterium]|nr:MAG: DUF115 domain-containing protein [Desulfobacteraceae bacterium]